MRSFTSILYLVCASLLSLWCVVCFVPKTPKKFTEVKQPEKVKIIFVGDVMCHAAQLSKAKTKTGYNFNNSFKYVKSIFADADLVVANLETPLSTTPPYSGYPTFKSPAELATALSAAGVDVAVTANNHALDMGTEGLLSTLCILEDCGIKSVGTYSDKNSALTASPLFIECRGVKFALLAYTYGTNGIKEEDGVVVGRLDRDLISADLERCAGADCTIAFLHWGDEYSATANIEQQKLADFLHSRGCSIVVGSHPHTVQQAECSKREVTIYSLGNFVSNQRFRYSDGGIMAEVTIEKNGNDCSFWLNIIPVWVRQQDYAVIPKNVGDTLSMTAEQRAAYNLFMADTEEKFTPQF